MRPVCILYALSGALLVFGLQQEGVVKQSKGSFNVTTVDPLEPCDANGTLGDPNIQLLYANCRGVFDYELRPNETFDAPFCEGVDVRVFVTSLGALLFRYKRGMVGVEQDVEFSLYSLPSNTSSTKDISHGNIYGICNPQWATFYDDIVRFENGALFHVQNESLVRRKSVFDALPCAAEDSASEAIDLSTSNVWRELRHRNLKLLHVFEPYVTYEQHLDALRVTTLVNIETGNKTCLWRSHGGDAVIAISSNESAYLLYDRSTTSTTTTEAPFVCPTMQSTHEMFYFILAAIVSILLSLIAMTIINFLHMKVREARCQKVETPEAGTAPPNGHAQDIARTPASTEKTASAEKISGETTELLEDWRKEEGKGQIPPDS